VSTAELNKATGRRTPLATQQHADQSHADYTGVI